MRASIVIAGTAFVLLLTGCSQSQSLLLQRLDPASPAAKGLAPLPAQDEPTPLTGRPSFGLYAAPPTPATLSVLANGRISPDGLYRAAMTEQGAWIARIDGAWLWQLELPPPPPPPAPPAQPGPRPPAPESLPPANVVLPLVWTSRNTLMFQDENGYWHEARPERAVITQLPAAFQGKRDLDFSPDGKQVLYATNVSGGQQLWVAAADGTNPKILGENVIGFWGPDGKPVVRQKSTQTPSTSPRSQQEQGEHRQ